MNHSRLTTHVRRKGIRRSETGYGWSSPLNYELL